MRILVLKRFIAAGLLLIWSGLFTTQVLRGPGYRKQAEQNRTRLIHLPAARGKILDRSGAVLVEDRLSFELAVFPRELKDPDRVWGRLSPIVGIPSEELGRRYRRGYEVPYSFVPILRDLPARTAFLLEEKKSELPGAFVRPIPRRHYLLGEALGPVAGYVGLIAPEELTHLRPYGYTFRDFVGKDGLEQMYDRFLRGRDGGLQVEVDVRGRFVRQLGFRVPEQGKSIQVSLDGRLQELCHKLLSDGDLAGAILVMESQTGEILALAGRPTFDPNAFVDPRRSAEVNHNLRRRDRPMYNRAIRSAVPPGSTFKIAVAYAALKAQKIALATAFHCPGFFELGNALFRCWKEEGHGPQTLREALTHSCNVFFYQVGRRLGGEGIAQAARLFGLGKPTGIDLPHESAGFVPDPAWMKAHLKQSWQPGDTVSFAIGQGPLQATPIQMLCLTTAVAMDGKVPVPHLLLSVEGERNIRHRNPTVIPLDPSVLAHVKAGMEEVVHSSSGTGRLAQIPGVRAAAKTGTAQVSRGRSHAWFLGYASAQRLALSDAPPRAEAERPRISFVVFLEHGGKGGEQAAGIARDLLIYLKELNYL